MIRIERVVSGLLASNMYVVTEDGHAIVIDPCEDTAPARGLRVDKILLTHEHYDHISGVNCWKAETGAPVLCSLACADNIRDPRKNLAAYFEDFCKLQTWMELDELPPSDPAYACSADETFEDEKSFAWMGHAWRLFALPGHSMGSIGILLDGKYFFSGDSLIENHEIGLGMPGGSKRKWREIGAPRLAMLPKGIRVFPGHFQEFVYS